MGFTRWNLSFCNIIINNCDQNKPFSHENNVISLSLTMVILPFKLIHIIEEKYCGVEMNNITEV